MDESEEGFTTVKRKSSDPGQNANKKASNEPLPSTSRDQLMGQSLKGNPRFRAYPASYNGIHDVFFMPKNKQLDVRAITA